MPIGRAGHTHVVDQQLWRHACARSLSPTLSRLAAIHGGIYPRERSWIDFKRRLYPETGDTAVREKVSQELAPSLWHTAGPLSGVGP
jgi:hypothetical protein